MGPYDAAAYFSIGTCAVLKLFDALAIPPGKFTKAGCQQQDQTRVHLHREKAKVTPKEEEKFSGAENGKM